MLADRLDLAEQRVAGAGGERRAPARFDAALGDRHRGRHDIDAADQVGELVLIDLLDRHLVALGELEYPGAVEGRELVGLLREPSGKCHQLVAFDGDALIDVEDHRQQRADEQQLALEAILGAKVVGHALDVYARHRDAEAHAGQRIGLVAEEARKLVGRARVDGARLHLTAHRVAGSGEATVAAGEVAHVEHGEIFRSGRGILEVGRDEDQRGGIGMQRRGERRQRAGGGLSERIEAQESGGVDVGKRLAQTDPGEENRRPGSGKGVFAPAIDCRLNRKPHASLSLTKTNDPGARPGAATLRSNRRWTLDWRAAYWTACTSTTSGT